MAEDAAARKQRLAKIAAGGRLKFRNYRPEDADLKAKAVAVALPKPILDEIAAKKPAAADLGAEDGPSAAKKAKKAPPVESAIQREIQAHESEHGGSELLNIAPRKPNWDLKRDVAKKMEKLNRRTQLAIVELIRERIAAEAQEGSDDGEGDESD